jgi:short-subunit dehydrogenase
MGHQILLKALIKNFFLKARIGTIIGVLSKAIGSQKEQVAKSMSSYIIAKSALKSMLSVCAAEFNWLKVRTVAPSFTKTKMLDVFDSRYLELLDGQKKFSTPENVAKLIINEII